MEIPVLTKIEVLLDKINLLVGDAKETGKMDGVECNLAIRYSKQLKTELKKLKEIPQINTQIKESDKPKTKPPKQKAVTNPEVKAEPADQKVKKIEPIVVDENKSVKKIDVSFVASEEVQETPKISEPQKPEIVNIVDPKLKAPLTKEENDNEDEKSLNERFGSIDNLAEKLKNKPIADLVNGIGLNDKFWFINELFDGKSDQYNRAIEKLNSIGSYTDAVQYLEEEVKPNFEWDGKDKSVEKFLKFILRRYL